MYLSLIAIITWASLIFSGNYSPGKAWTYLPLQGINQCFTWLASEVGNHQWFTGLPWRLRQWRIWLQCGRPRFNPWVRKIPWRLEWLPTPVFLPGEAHGQRSLAGYSPWGHRESYTTDHTHTHPHTHTHTHTHTHSHWLTLALLFH